MANLVFDRIVLLDTSAAIALLDSTDSFHADARTFVEANDSLRFCAVNISTHEAFTRARYSQSLPFGLTVYDFMRSKTELLHFSEEDEQEARTTLERYRDQRISFHDALCASVMLRTGIYRVFTFDKDFWVMGFEVVPGRTT